MHYDNSDHTRYQVNMQLEKYGRKISASIPASMFRNKTINGNETIQVNPVLLNLGQ